MKALTPPFITTSQASGQKCCPNGHPVQTDPVTGRSTCSCQMQTTLPAYLSRVPGLPETMYGAGTSQISLLQRHMATSALYHVGADDRYSTALKAAPPSGHLPYSYEHLMAAHPYAAMYPGFDINGMKRKNATRESTSALKAWLYQHRKNPYPTKAEKVMLAIVSQMTLTQVSTWFANARRRLKKENKMEENDIDLDDIDADDRSTTSRQSDFDGDITSHENDSPKLSTDTSDISDVDEQSTNDNIPAKSCVQRLFSPDARNELYLERISSPEESSSRHTVNKVERSAEVNQRLSDINTKVTTESSETDKDSKSALDLRRVSKSANSSEDNKSQNQPSRKIWSIANIIG